MAEDSATDRDLRDRLARAEQNHLNLKENFTSFKDEVTRKLETLIDDVQGIKVTIAKWMGGFAVVFAIIEVAVKKFV